MFKEAKAKSEYSGLIDLVLEKKDDNYNESDIIKNIYYKEDIEINLTDN